jgi:hypothetical protein
MLAFKMLLECFWVCVCKDQLQNGGRSSVTYIELKVDANDKLSNTMQQPTTHTKDYHTGQYNSLQIHYQPTLLTRQTGQVWTSAALAAVFWSAAAPF